MCIDLYSAWLIQRKDFIGMRGTSRGFTASIVKCATGSRPRYQNLTDPARKDARSIYLSTVFLANRARVDPTRPSLAYGLTLGVRVPDSQIRAPRAARS